MCNILEIIKSRRSIRKFRPNPIPRELIEKILEAARWAPSAHNAQPWRFVVIRDYQMKLKLAKAMAEAWRRDLIKDGVSIDQISRLIEESVRVFTSAPVLIVVCLTMENMHRYPDERRNKVEYIMAVQSVAAAIQNILLSAHALGLGVCWKCAPLFCPDVVRYVLKIPHNIDPQAILIIGYNYEKPKPQPRLSLENIVHYETWS
ncbi:MAG: nitroreductase family protein [Thermoprotei archaeon]|nr:MAG: nitroreductase family protein [Thermoprotei archaeon]